MDSLSQLLKMLESAMGNRESQHTEQELFEELMVRKPCLLTLFNVGGRDPQAKRELESGQLTIDGQRIFANTDFRRLGIFLSQQLDCSERYAAEILNKVTSENPNLTAVEFIETAVVEFHHRRRVLVDCVCDLVSAARLFTELEDLAQPSLRRLVVFVEDELIHGLSGEGSESWSLRIFREMNSLDNVLGVVHNSRQGAGSNTIAPSGQGTPGLAYHVLHSRYESLKYERRKLAFALCGLAQLGVLSSDDINAIIDWLSRNPNHSMTFYILTVVFNALDSSDPQTKAGQSRHKLAIDVQAVASMRQLLAPAKQWNDHGLKSTVLLRWTLFLAESRHYEPALEDRDGFRAEELEANIWSAVQGDAFKYLALTVLQLQQIQSNPITSSIISSLALSPEQREHRLPPAEDFKLFVLSALQSLVRSLITHASSELRKIKQRQEDLFLAGARTERSKLGSRFGFTSTVRSAEVDKPSVPRNDIAMLYAFIGLLYSSLPTESALQFWGAGFSGDSSGDLHSEYLETTAGRLPTFLQWAVWSTSAHDIAMSMALYDMLSGLSKGQQCSELAYNFMARGGGEVIPGSMLLSSTSSGPSVSWSSIFSMLEAWASASAAPRQQKQPHQSLGPMLSSFAQPPQSTFPNQISAAEVLLAQSFLRLLSIVVTYSTAVRLALAGQTNFRAIPTLISLIPLGVPLELKGALFDTLSSFCEPGAGIPGVEICKAVWMLMEKFEVINVRVTSTSGTLPVLRGIEAELHEIEAVNRVYPSTIPFLKLLSTLIHTTKRIPLRIRLAELQPSSTIPENLGQPYRSPGVGPFTSFVIDKVFLNIANIEYSDPSDRWQMNDLCLSYIERSLASFDLEAFVASPDADPTKAQSLLMHPGYDVMNRVLTSSPLQANILTYIVEGVKGFEKGLADEQPFFGKTIIRVLRIVHRVLEVQDIFLDVLIPLLLELDITSITGAVHPRSYFVRFEQALSFGPHYIPAIIAYVTYSAYQDLVLMAIQIISALSSSNSSSSNLAKLLFRSSDSDRIMRAFMEIVGAETLDDVSEAETIAEQTTGAGAPDCEGTSELTQAIRLAALDLFIQETEASRSVPNVGMVLLFGELEIKQVQDPHALGAQSTCIHILLELLLNGIPRLKNNKRDKNVRDHTIPLSICIPALAERCYRIIHQLCTHPKTFDFMLRYLRSHEDFFARQLAHIPSLVPQVRQDPYIQVQYQDGSRVFSTVSAASSFFRLRSCIFDLAALDLHILTGKGQLKGAAELLGILFGNGSGYKENADLLQPFHEVGQSHVRIIEFLQSLQFEWSDSVSVEPTELRFLGQLNLLSCLRKNSYGCQIVDRGAVLSMLSAAKKALHAQGVIGTTASAEQLQREATYVLESCVVENHRRELVHSVAAGYEAWRRLLDVALMKSFNQLPRNRRENILFDLLHVLPSIIRSSDLEEFTAVLLSEVLLSVITKLREDRRQQIIMQCANGNPEASLLPAERLCAVFRNILEGILDSRNVELVRGNMYAAVINYIHLVTSPIEDMSLYARKSRSNHSVYFHNGMSAPSLDRLGRSEQSLATFSAEAMKHILERLVKAISRDAIDGSEVWRTVAFMLLDALVQLSATEKNPPVLVLMTRLGILSTFVQGLKESDAQLLAVLKPDPDDLNALFVYEAKMSLFVRMSQIRSGANRLLDAHLVPVLAHCDYLDARPEADQSFIDHDYFLPSAVQRYHQLFIPALQVVDGMLSTIGNEHASMTNQVLDFLSSHSPTIVILLKSMDYVSLSLLEEILLVINLSTNMLPSIPRSEILSTNSGFGAIHAAILSLATRCLGQGRCFTCVTPQLDAEIQQAGEPAFGHRSETRFDLKVREREWSLRKSITAYIGAASDFTESEITLVVSPITAPQHRYLTEEQSQAASFLATIPTTGDSVAALNSLYTDLTEVLQQISNLSAELESRDHAAADNIAEVVTDIPTALLQELDVGQRRELMCDEMGKVRRMLINEAQVLLDSTEMLLLVLWRHVQYYTSPAFTAPSVPSSLPPKFPSQASTTTPGRQNVLNSAMRLLASSNPETFKEEVRKKLGPLLGKLEGLDLTMNFDNDRNWSQEYIEIMARRLRSLLHDLPQENV